MGSRRTAGKYGPWGEMPHFDVFGHGLHHLLRERVADDGYVEWKRSRRDDIVILVGIEAVMAKADVRAKAGSERVSRMNGGGGS
jgi:hypothetical protein